MKQHLLHFFPFLKKDFRTIEESEINSEETFKELFPDEPIDLYKLKAVAAYQKSNIQTFVVTGKAIKSVQKLERNREI